MNRTVSARYLLALLLACVGASFLCIAVAETSLSYGRGIGDGILTGRYWYVIVGSGDTFSVLNDLMQPECEHIRNTVLTKGGASWASDCRQQIPPVVNK
jgi:hypothetical protein